MIWGPINNPAGFNDGAALTNALNDADNKVAAIFHLEKDAPGGGGITIDGVGFEITALAGTPPAYSVGLFTVDTSGNPTTTNYGGSATKAYTPTSTGWKWVTLDTPATGSSGDLFAVVMKPGGTPPDGSNNVTVAYGRAGNTLISPLSRRFLSAWAVGAAPPAMSYRFSDGQAGWPGWAGAPSTSINTGTTPDEVGSLFTLPMAATCIGAILTLNLSSLTDFTIKLYDSDGASVLASVAIDASQFGTSPKSFTVYWDPVALLASTNYRLTILPTTANSVVMADITCESAASKDWFPEGANWQKTKRTDAGAWSQDALNIIPMALVISHMTLPG